MKFIKNTFTNLKNKIVSLPKIIRILILIALIGGIGFFTYSKIHNNNSSDINYKTTIVETGSLITSISATGTITSSNKTSITTGATGTIKTVYVANGDTVTKGQKIADITLDDDGTYNQTVAWANYTSMLEKQQQAVADQTSADITMWQDRQNLLDAQDEYNNMVAGAWNPKTNAEYTYNEKAIVTKQFELAKEKFTADETTFNNYNAVIAKAKQQTSDAYDNYKKVSSVIYAPSAGTISNLSIASGVIISNSSDSITVSTGTSSNENSSSVSSHTIGSITNPDGQYQATLSLTESEIVKIKAGQKVTMTLDAFEDATFTGEVLSVDVAGSTTSGVTSYSVVVLLDDTDKEIYTNMAVTATIITDSQADVLLIPSTAIDTDAEGNSTVLLMADDGTTSTVTVTLGSTNDSQTVVLEGLSQGDTIVASSIANQAKSNNNTSSDFSSTNSNRSGGSFMMSGGGAPPGM